MQFCYLLYCPLGLVKPQHGEGDGQTAQVTQQIGQMSMGPRGQVPPSGPNGHSASPTGRNGHSSPSGGMGGKQSPQYDPGSGVTYMKPKPEPGTAGKP